ADAILARQSDAPAPVFDDRLVEVDYGPDEGLPETAVIARIGKGALEAWERDATVPPGWHVDPAALRQAWHDLLADAKDTTLIVTSNGVARFVLDVAEHDGAERKLKTGAYGILQGSGDVWRVTEWNVRP
ncbi:MAG: histidine phosphatase family protein, partial [Litorimonas sp.]